MAFVRRPTRPRRRAPCRVERGRDRVACVLPRASPQAAGDARVRRCDVARNRRRSAYQLRNPDGYRTAGESRRRGRSYTAAVVLKRAGTSVATRRLVQLCVDGGLVAL